MVRLLCIKAKEIGKTVIILEFPSLCTAVCRDPAEPNFPSTCLKYHYHNMKQRNMIKNKRQQQSYALFFYVGRPIINLVEMLMNE